MRELYIDISQFEKGRANTGIQRVVKELIQRALRWPFEVYIVLFDAHTKEMLVLENAEVDSFLKDIRYYQFQTKKRLSLEVFQKSQKEPIFFDIDSVWNTLYKREELYPLLKEYGFVIYNFIYDLIPLALPEVAHAITRENFEIFFKTLCAHSDMVFFDSTSAQQDFFTYKKRYTSRYIPTRVVGLGSDFSNILEEKAASRFEHFFTKKYILFVGTIEPRKKQEMVLDAFEQLSKEYDDLELIFIGKQGWYVQNFINRLTAHHLYNKRIFWLNDVDDVSLHAFYKHAFLVTYLSRYEGFGLPIVESLGHGNITITSKNSSMYEAGRDFADYIVYDSLAELTAQIALYCDNDTLYKNKKEYISKGFQALSWDAFADSIVDVLKNLDKAKVLQTKHREKLAFVFISIRPEAIEETLRTVEKNIDFVKEFIIITSAQNFEAMKRLKTSYPLRIFEESKLLSCSIKEFSKKDHQSKNWLLRTVVTKIENLTDEFIMLDDDNLISVPLTLDKFISKEGRYKAYYFYELLQWHHTQSDYDKGQQETKKVLSKKNYELFSYSSHAPQIINKQIFKEAVAEFYETGLQRPIDEWSIYFNYAVSHYPTLFEKCYYETLNWPQNPTDWDAQLNELLSFENYYEDVYKSGFFSKTDSFETKVAKKKRQMVPYEKTKSYNEELLALLKQENMIHGVLSFQHDENQLFIFGLPYLQFVHKGANLRFRCNYKLLNIAKKHQNLQLVIRCNGVVHLQQPLVESSHGYAENIVEFSLATYPLREGTYNYTFDILWNEKPIYKENTPYMMKIVVLEQKNLKDYIEFKPLRDVHKLKELTLKEKIKAIPFFGWFARWGYNLLRLNNIKHILFHNTQRLTVQQQQLQRQQQQLQRQQQQLQHLQMLVEQQQRFIEKLPRELQKEIASEVAQEISYQTDALTQRVDQFIFDAKIDLQLQQKHEKK